MDQQMTRAGRNRWRNTVVVALGISLIACGGGGDAERDAATAAATGAATGSGPADLPQPSDDWKPKIRTATLPENLCDLIPVEEVEAILGKLAEPPKKQDGCRYILPVPEAVTAKREQA